MTNIVRLRDYLPHKGGSHGNAWWSEITDNEIPVGVSFYWTSRRNDAGAK